MNRTNLLAQPVEILDEIISAIETPKDLLSLALVTYAFKDKIIPHHLEYRWISCSLYRDSLWRFLSEHPRYATRIRKLGIIDEKMNPNLSSLRVPRAFRKEKVSEPDLIRETHALSKDLIYAIRGMKTLGQFDWISVRGPSEGWWKDLVEAMKYSRCNILSLRGAVYMYDEGISMTPPYRFGEPLWNIPATSLQKLRLRLSMHGDNITQFFTAIVQSINSYPQLCELSIVVKNLLPPTAEGYFPILSQGNWPNLTKLTLETRFPLYDTDTILATDADKAATMSDFLLRHSRLEALKITSPEAFTPGCIPMDALPRLHSISTIRLDGRVQPCLSKVVPVEVARHLRHVEAFVSHGCAHTLSQMTDLRSCNVLVKSDALETFCKAAKWIERLNLQLHSAVRNHNVRKCIQSDTIPSLQNLTHFGGVLSQSQMDPESDMADILQQITHAPKLKYVEVSGAWMELVRDSRGRFLGTKWDRLPKDVKPERWSNFMDVDFA